MYLLKDSLQDKGIQLPMSLKLLQNLSGFYLFSPFLKVLKKAIFNSSSKNLSFIFWGIWVRVKLIIHVQRTSKVHRTL